MREVNEADALHLNPGLPPGVQPLCNGSALRKAGRRLAMLYGVVLAPSGLRQSQHSLLAHIERSGGQTISALAADMVLDRSALSHNLKPMVRDGLVALERDAADARAKRVVLTEAGQAKLRETQALWNVAHVRFEHLFGEDKAAALRALLEEVYSEEFAAAFANAD
jgi:DNA-binding MarR family transcriptional regulator